MEKLITVSPSPHVYSNTSISKLMWGVIIAMVPILIVSFIYFGLGALVVTASSVAATVFFEFIITKIFLKQRSRINDGSAIVTGILLAFNVPSNLPVWIIFIGALVAIGVGKMSFGGLGNNPFNPALVGRVFLLISFPTQMTSWPKPDFFSFKYLDAVTGATSLGRLSEEGVKSVNSLLASSDSFNYMNFFLGDEAGSLGEISAFAILIGLGFLLIRKIITWHIPAATLGSAVLLAGILWLIDPNSYADPLFHLLTGGLMLGAVFMATDYATSPMSAKGMLIFGAGIGFLTILIRAFGSFPEGISFAILLMNAMVPLINKSFKPKRFGEKIQPA